MFVQWRVKQALFLFLKKNSKDRKEIQTLNQIRKNNFTEYCHCSLKTGRAQMCRSITKSNKPHALGFANHVSTHVTFSLKASSLHFCLHVLEPEHHGSFLPLEALIRCSHWGNSARDSTPRWAIFRSSFKSSDWSPFWWYSPPQLFLCFFWLL